MYEKQSRNTNRSTDTIASFLLKTYEILEHPEYERMISWDKSNVGFIIHDVLLFTRQILPKYFRHSNFSSFVRQLNMYDFHKVKQQNESLVFKNPLFCKGQQQNLKFIRRKAARKIGGQRRQQMNQKNDVQNEKYQNLLKGFKKSLETQINQSSVFYQKSIQMIRDLNQSNQKKQEYIGNLYQTEEKVETAEQNQKQEPKKSPQVKAQQPRKPRKDTIIQIPKQFLELSQSQQQIPVLPKKKSLNLDTFLRLKQQLYKSLGIYETWLQDYIDQGKRKIRYINGYKQQLVKCREIQREEKQNDENQYDEGENGQEAENVKFQPQQAKLEGEAGQIVKIQQQDDGNRRDESLKKVVMAKNSQNSGWINTYIQSLPAQKLFWQQPVSQQQQKQPKPSSGFKFNKILTTPVKPSPFFTPIQQSKQQSVSSEQSDAFGDPYSEQQFEYQQDEQNGV